jgi:hypothetical protein
MIFGISGILRDLWDLQELFEHLILQCILESPDLRLQKFEILFRVSREMAAVIFPDLWSLIFAVFYNFLVPRSSRHIQFGL